MGRTKKILSVVLVVFIALSLCGCDKYKAYREALIGQWCDESGFIGFDFIDEEQCEVYYASEYIVSQVSCSYTYEDGRVKIYHPDDAERYVEFLYFGDGDDEDLSQFCFAGLEIHKSPLNVQSRAEWAESYAQEYNGTLNEIAQAYVEIKFGSEAIDWIIEQLVATN